MTDFDAGPLLDADLVDGTLVLTRDVPRSPGEVWAALTAPALLAKWSPFTEHPAVVRHTEPPNVVEYTWGDDILRWEVGGGRLTLRHTMAERERAPEMAAGWHLCLAVLQRLLDGDPVEPIVGQRAMDFGWEHLREQYAKVLSR